MKTSPTREGFSAVTPFKDAAWEVGRAWRKKYGYGHPAPVLSHALSIYEDGKWTMLDTEQGEPVAVVQDGRAVLVEDVGIAVNDEWISV